MGNPGTARQGRVVYDVLNRVNDIPSAASATPTDGTPLADSSKFVQYEYLGAATVVIAEYSDVTGDPKLTHVDAPGDNRYDQTLDRYTYGYDGDSNRLYRKNEQSAAHSELYHANGASANTQYDGPDGAFHRHAARISGRHADGSDGCAASLTQGLALRAGALGYRIPALRASHVATRRSAWPGHPGAARRSRPLSWARDGPWQCRGLGQLSRVAVTYAPADGYVNCGAGNACTDREL